MNESQEDEIQEIVDNLPKSMSPHDITVFFLATLDCYDIDADEARKILIDTFGIYADHKRRCAMN